MFEKIKLFLQNHSGAVSLIARVVLGLIFVYASIEKITYPEPFAQNIIAYEILPQALANIAAIWLPWLEMFCGLLLIAGIWVRANAAILSILLTIFIIAIASALIRGLDISCGCFEVGDSEAMVGWRRVIEDAGMMILSLWLMKFPRSHWALEK
ncbi:DoxX family membrane protein [bacterium]|nr:DoxX family membrane protein [bacterium]